MLQLRLIVPPELHDPVRERLAGCAGVAHVVRVPGAGLRPAGDRVICDVAREAADALLDELKAAGLEERGAIAVSDSGAVLSPHVAEAEREAPGEGADAVIWAQVSEAARDESVISLTFLAFLAVATMLAACGVMLDSAILIVGAMAVGPEFGPLAAFCVSLVQGRLRWSLRSLTTLVVSFVVAMVLTYAFVAALDAAGLIHRSQFEGPRPATAFIWQPNLMSLVVAALAGVAGMLSLTSSKTGALVGVAISVTTVPAAANAAIALYYGDLHQALGSFTQLFVNLGGIVAAGTVTLLAQRVSWRALTIFAERRRSRG
jgi:uncharacterized hydrophobic protein (TIGR00271 family)